MDEQKEENLTTEEQRDRETDEMNYGTEFTTTTNLNGVILEAPVKKKKKGLIALIATLIIVAITGGCVLIFGPRRIVNTLYQTVASDSTYYTWVEKNNTLNLLLAAITSQAKEGSMEADINLSLNANITSFLSVPIDKIRIQIANQYKQQQLQTDYVLSYGTNSVLDVTTIVDKKNQGVYAQFPELSEKLISVFGEDITITSLLSAEKAPKLISNYLKDFVNALDLSVELEKAQEFTLGEVTFKGTKIVVTYPVAEALKELSNQFSIMKADDDMFQVLSEVGMKKSDYKTLMDSLSTKTKELSASVSDDEVLTMTCYVDEEGLIVGRIIELDVKDTEYKFSFLTGSDQKIAGNLEVGGLSLIELNGTYQSSKEFKEILTITEDNVVNPSEYAAQIGEDAIDEYIKTIVDRLGLSAYSSFLGISDTDNEDAESSEEGFFEFTLGEYTGISIQKPMLEVTEEEIQEEIKAFVELYSDMIPVTDRNIVKEGDFVNIDYVGTVDGAEFSGGSATDSELGIGTNTFIDGFEDQLIGASVGETVIVKVTFPEAYGSAELAGKAAEFTVTVNAIGKREFTDEFVAYNTDYTTTEEYKDYVYQGILETKEFDIQSAIDEEIISQVVANATFTNVNQREIDEKETEMLSMYEYYAQYYGVDLETFAATGFQMSLDEFYAQIKFYADLYVKETYVLAEIAKLEGITLTEDEYQQRVEEINLQYGYETTEDLEASYGGRDELEKVLLQEKTIEFLRSVSNIVE